MKEDSYSIMLHLFFIRIWYFIFDGVGSLSLGSLPPDARAYLEEASSWQGAPLAVATSTVS